MSNIITDHVANRESNAIRALAIDAIEKAKSGHPGMPMGMADLAHVLWKKHLSFNPDNPTWINRDRFILSNGHGSMLLYAMLHLTGYDISLDDIKSFRQLHAKTAGHPEYDVLCGIEMTTGPLGQGLATSVGMALAEKMLAAKYNKPEFPVFDHYTYVFAGDGDLMEGVSHESCSLAGTWQLDKLIVIWDDNGISIDGDIKNWMTTNVPERFRAYQWHVIEHVDGHDLQQIDDAIAEAKKQSKPTLICAKTHIGFGSPNRQDTAKIHGSPLGAEEMQATKEALGWHEAPFAIPEDIYDYFDSKALGLQREQQWHELLNAYQKAYPELAKQLSNDWQKSLPEDFQANLDQFLQTALEEKPALATRQASAKVIHLLANHMPYLLGGSADLTGSNGTAWPTMVSLDPTKLDGFNANYIHYGVREFGMSAIMNGLQLHGGFQVFGGTFLAFSDYARPAVRLSALMENPVIYIYTHDSIGLGEDGPTHQPVEHVDSLRLIPHLNVFRPADLVETTCAWIHAIQCPQPTALILSRQKVPALAHQADRLDLVSRGAYILKDADQADIILFASGTEVSLAVATADLLTQQGRAVKVVSVPCMKVFFEQEPDYQQQVLDVSINNRVAIEAGSSALWTPFIGAQGIVCGVDDFGLSGPAEQIYDHFGLTAEKIAATIIQGENNDY